MIMEGEHPNCQAVETFLAELGDKISRPVVSTERINGTSVKEGYTASYMDNDRGIGFTVIAWANGQFKVIIEMGGSTDRAASDGELAARVFAMPSKTDRDR